METFAGKGRSPASFFSKIVLRNAKRRLSELGYEIRIGKIARADGDIGDEQQG